MINIFKQWFIKFRELKNIDIMIKEYEAVSFVIDECYTMDDFIYCKKKIRRFQHHWDIGGESTPGAKFSKKLNDKYNKRLIRQKYNIGLHAEKAKKKTL